MLRKERDDLLRFKDKHGLGNDQEKEFLSQQIKQLQTEMKIKVEENESLKRSKEHQNKGQEQLFDMHMKQKEQELKDLHKKLDQQQQREADMNRRIQEQEKDLLNLNSDKKLLEQKNEDLREKIKEINVQKEKIVERYQSEIKTLPPNYDDKLSELKEEIRKLQN